MNDIYAINQSCDLIENNNNAIIFFNSKEKVFILNEIENEIFNLIKEKNTLDMITGKLSNKYSAEKELITNDVANFVDNLLKADLISNEEIIK